MTDKKTILKGAVCLLAGFALLASGPAEAQTRFDSDTLGGLEARSIGLEARAERQPLRDRVELSRVARGAVVDQGVQVRVELRNGLHDANRLAAGGVLELNGDVSGIDETVAVQDVGPSAAAQAPGGVRRPLRRKPQ